MLLHPSTMRTGATGTESTELTHVNRKETTCGASTAFPLEPENVEVMGCTLFDAEFNSKLIIISNLVETFFSLIYLRILMERDTFRFLLLHTHPPLSTRSQGHEHRCTYLINRTSLSAALHFFLSVMNKWVISAPLLSAWISKWLSAVFLFYNKYNKSNSRSQRMTGKEMNSRKKFPSCWQKRCFLAIASTDLRLFLCQCHPLPRMNEWMNV